MNTHILWLLIGLHFFLLHAQSRQLPPIRKNLETTIRRLTSPEFEGRAFRSDGGRKAAVYLAGIFKQAGLRSPDGVKEYLQPIDGGGQNVVGLIDARGPQAKDEYVLITAHYDAFGGSFTGAADNAAGVGVLTELSRLAATESLPRHFLFIAFDGEEQNKAGSRFYAAHPVIPIEKTVATISLHNFGRGMSDYLPDTLYLFGSEQSPQLRDAIGRNRDGAAHLAFFGTDALHLLEREHFDLSAQKIPFLLITNGYHYTAHQRQDVPDRLNFNALDRHVRSISKALFDIARTEGRIEWAAEPIYDAAEASDWERVLTALREAVIKSPGNEAGLAQLDDVLLELKRFRDRAIQNTKAREAIIHRAARLCWMIASPNAVEYLDLQARAQAQQSRGEREKAIESYGKLLKFIEEEYRRDDLTVQSIRDRLEALRK